MNHEHFVISSQLGRLHKRNTRPDVTNSLFPESLHERHFISVPDPVAKDIKRYREEKK